MNHANDTVQPVPEPLATYGVRLGAIVRVDGGHPRVGATLLLGYGEPVLTVNVGAIGTPHQAAIVAWAIGEIGRGVSGLSVYWAEDAPP
jgi:hypothetical protein